MAGHPPIPNGAEEPVAGAVVAAAEALGIGVVVVSLGVPEPELLYVSDLATKLLGQTSGAVIGQRALGLAPPEEQSRLRELLEVVVQHEPRAWHLAFETAMLHQEGHQVSLEVTASESTMDGRPVAV